MVNASDSRIDFPGKDPQEIFRLYFRRHWSRIVRYVVFASTWTILGSALVWVSGVASIADPITRRGLGIILLLFLLAAQWWLMAKLYKHFLCVTIVTDKKVHSFFRTLLAEDRHVSMDLWVLQDIDKTQRGIMQNLLQFGSLRLEAQNSHLTLHMVPHINETYDRIVLLREEARHRQLPHRPKQA